MGVLKLIGYLVAAVAVLTALAMGALSIIVLGIVGGLLLDFVAAAVFTAYGLRNYFDSNKRSDSD